MVDVIVPSLRGQLLLNAIGTSEREAASNVDSLFLLSDEESQKLEYLKAKLTLQEVGQDG